MLGQQEVVRLLDCADDAYRPLVATALFTGMRISELLGLIWDDIALPARPSTSARSSHAPIATYRRYG